MSLRIIPAAALLALTACDLTSPGTPAAPEVSRPAAQLLVERYSRAGVRSFYTMSIDRRFISPFTGVPSDALQLFPSPNGETIAYLRDFDGLVHLWYMDRFGGLRVPVVADERVIQHVAWSPDGTRLLIAGSTMEESDDIWSMPVNGTALTNLTPDPKPAIYADRSPTWSPDGGRIAFVSNRSGTMHLWLMDANGSNKVQVVPPSSQSSELAAVWSPDGSLIAFEGRTSDGAGVGVVQPNGSGFRFFPLPGDPGRVAWLPDGRLLYSTNVTGDYELYARDLASGAVENLTRHTDHDLRATILARADGPAWRGFVSAYAGSASITNPSAVVVADAIADGHPDIFVAAPAQSQIRVWQGAGNFVFAPLGSLESADDVRDLAVGDVSADGVADIVARGDAAFSVYRGSAAGPGVRTVHDVGGDVRSLVLRDSEGAGIPHVVVAVDRPEQPIHIRLYGDNGAGTGTVIALLDMGTDYLRAGGMCVGDITGGGSPDLILASPIVLASLILFPGRGDISFDESIVVAAGAGTTRASRLICDDLDGDGRSDLVLFDRGVRGIVFRRSLGANLAPPLTIDVVASGVAAADLDHDGDVDLLVASANASSLLFLRNLGDARFADPVSVPLAFTPTHVTIGDVNGDGWQDAVAVSAAGALAVLRNAGRIGN